MVHRQTLSRRLSVSRVVPLCAVAVLGLTACGGGSAGTSSAGGAPAAGSDERPRVVVTYPVLGAVVAEVVGDAAEVTVLMPNGSDPHQWSPSARDIKTMLSADLVIDNGLGLEGNLQDPLKGAKDDGVKVFTVAEHVTVRTVKAGEGAVPSDPDQATGAQDPHLWMDPLTMKQWVGPLVPALKAVGVEVAASATTAEKELDGLNSEVAALLETVPANRRKLVTGHESLGYLAERYDYTLVGAVVPSVTSQGDASAGELAVLAKKIEAAGVPAIFTELGTPSATVVAIAKDSDATVVELSTHTLPKDGTYRTFMLDLATKIAGALR